MDAVSMVPLLEERMSAVATAILREQYTVRLRCNDTHSSASSSVWSGSESGSEIGSEIGSETGSETGTGTETETETETVGSAWAGTMGHPHGQISHSDNLCRDAPRHCCDRHPSESSDCPDQPSHYCVFNTRSRRPPRQPTPTCPSRSSNHFGLDSSISPKARAGPLAACLSYLSPFSKCDFSRRFIDDGFM